MGCDRSGEGSAGEADQSGVFTIEAAAYVR
ncbi:hypothetical protein QFZ68_002524 [Streptomyces sp. V1I6]|nr:hypothetical protein [Streptomyces sp. V1I6]